MGNVEPLMDDDDDQSKKKKLLNICAGIAIRNTIFLSYQMNMNILVQKMLAWWRPHFEIECTKVNRLHDFNWYLHKNQMLLFRFNSCCY